MKHKLSFIILALLVCFGSKAQDLDAYKSLVDEAYELYSQKKYSESAQKYTDAFDKLNGKAYWYDRYNAACVYALANEKDSAFTHLYILAKESPKYRYYAQITIDPDFMYLYSDNRWDEIISIVLANKREDEKGLELGLVGILDTVNTNDQRYRQQLDKIEKKHGRNSIEITKHWELISYYDSLNLIQVKKILDERGWLGPEVIGGQGNSTLFLVIQHADQKTQEQYLPMMREAVKNKKASSSSLALLEDRVALGKGEKQLYGSQIGREEVTGDYYVLPLIDPENVDVRRAEMGLDSLDEYCKNWNFSWDVQKHIEMAKKLEAEKKE